MHKTVSEFLRVRLGDRTAPSDLSLLLQAFSKHENFDGHLDNPLTHFGAVLMWSGQTYSLLEHDYLNDRDRANPDIMSNVSAMQDTDKNLRFVLQHEDGSMLGYWQPSVIVPLSECALFWLDTEGQYYIAEGGTLSETLAYRALIDGYRDRYDAIVKSFEKLGVVVSEASKDDIFSAMDRRQASVRETPQDYRQKRYKHYRGAAGLG